MKRKIQLALGGLFLGAGISSLLWSPDSTPGHQDSLSIVKMHQLDTPSPSGVSGPLTAPEEIEGRLPAVLPMVEGAASDPLPPELKEFRELRRKVVRTAREQSEWRRRITDPATRQTAAEQINKSLSGEDRLDAVGFLLEGLSSPDPAVQLPFVDSVEQTIITADLDSGSPEQRRERGADVAELAMGLAVTAPDRANGLLTSTSGVKRTLIDRALRYVESVTREAAAAE